MNQTLSQAKKDIAAKKPACVYFLTGDDTYSKKEFIKTVKTALSPDEFNYFEEDGSSCDMGGFLNAANGAPVFSDTRMAVLNNADKLRKNAADALAAYLADPMPSTCFIVCHNDAKKAKKDKALLSACSDLCSIVNFEELSGAALATWIQNKFQQQGLVINYDALEMMQDIIGGDLAALSGEIEKLALYTLNRQNKEITQDDILASVGFSKEENPFALSNAVLACDKAAALKLIDNMLAAREEPVSILNKISSPVVKMLKIKRLAAAGYNQYEIVSLGGLLPWEGKLVSRAAAMPKAETLTKALNKIIETDMDFKSTSSTDAAVALKGIILTALSR